MVNHNDLVDVNIISESFSNKEAEEEMSKIVFKMMNKKTSETINFKEFKFLSLSILAV